MAAEIANRIKLVIPAGQATPAPPLGPILGQNGIDIQGFCSEFNEKSQSLRGYEVPVEVTVYKDRSFRMKVKQPTVASMIKMDLKVTKGSSEPNKNKVKTIKRSDLKAIAEKKLEDLNTKKLESAIKIVEGTAKSMGIEVTD